MILFPAILYRSPGNYKNPNGTTYSIVGVQNQEQFDEQTAAGWVTTSIEAIKIAGDKAFPVAKPMPKWKLKPKKKVKAAKPLNWRELAKAAPAPIPDTEPVPTDSEAPTRSELEAKATELGIRFDGRTKDKKLGQLIQDRLTGE